MAKTTAQEPAQCRLNGFLMGLLLWGKVSADVDKTYVDYEAMYKEVGLKKPEAHIVQHATTRLKDQDVIVATGRSAFKRGSNAKIQYVGQDIEPLPKAMPGFKLKSGQIYDLLELATQLKQRSGTAAALPKPTPGQQPMAASPTPAPQSTPSPALVVSREVEATPAILPNPSGNGKTHHLPELDYTPLALRAKAEGLRAQAQQLIQQAETLEETARIKELFTHTKEIMES